MVGLRDGWTASDDRPSSSFDFRRPNRVSREVQVGLEAVHELFVRRLGTAWGSAVRAVVELEPLGIEQVTFEDYTRSMPTPNVLAVVRLTGTGTLVILELSVQLALAMVERLLGSTGTVQVSAPRRPTDLEAALVRDLMARAAGTLGDALQELSSGGAELLSLDFSPHLVQTYAPSDMVLLLSYRVGMRQGADAEGLLSVCYAIDPLLPHLDELVRPRRAAAALGDGAAGPGVELQDVTVRVAAQLAGTAIGAAEVAGLRPGDVLRTDHRIGDPALLWAGDVAVGTADVGRKGRRLAVQVVEPPSARLAREALAPAAAVATALPSPPSPTAPTA